MAESKRPTVAAPALSLADCWDEFEHEVVVPPLSQSGIDEEGNLYVSVRVTMHHWIGDKEQAKPARVTHTMGWTVPLEKLWAVPDGCEGPYRSCTGRDCRK